MEAKGKIKNLTINGQDVTPYMIEPSNQDSPTREIEVFKPLCGGYTVLHGEVLEKGCEGCTNNACGWCYDYSLHSDITNKKDQK